jgi:tRNA (adenine57-N1/adenine58-N1)-methyltransferase
MKFDKKLPYLLVDSKGRSYVVPQAGEMVEIQGLGVIDMGRVRKTDIGGTIDIAGKEFTLLHASLVDVLAHMERGPQIIMPKDSAQILVGCGIRPGGNVLEIGAGSGALTMVLAHVTGHEGRVVSYEKDRKNAEIVLRNLELAGLEDIVEVRVADAISLPDERFDAAVTDVPQPWDFLNEINRVLNVSGYVCAYVPTMNQVEATVRAMRECAYADMKSVENLQREIMVGTGGTRPSFEMLGHTGYLCFGRKVR